ncbi:MAG: hypothetical protein JXR47_05295 [Thiotrichales bacterium]|nr:hypothetical protein [Thiotrichales bacterium]
MNGQRKTKQPGKKEAIQRMEKAEILAAMREMELERLNKNWGLKFDMAVKLFAAALDDAGTLGEAKRWYESWTQGVESIDHSAEDAGEQMDALIEQHGFEFSLRPVDVSHQEMCGRS